MEEKINSEIFKLAFDTMPLWIFVVDKDLRIQEYNEQASKIVGTKKDVVIKKRTGDVLQCINSKDTVQGCGASQMCSNCIIRNSINESFKGNRIFRSRTRIEIIDKENKKDIYALITTCPFVYNEEHLALLIIEDIDEIAELHRIIPVCSVCKKMRDDKESWMMVESYFVKNWDIGFSHGYCPECFEKEMKKLQQDIQNHKK